MSGQQPPPQEPAQKRSSSALACAACKYQRRKCAADCPLAPHFPPTRHKEFHNAHKLFGVSNMLKITRDLSPGRRSLAMKTIIHQANLRALDPVGGCYHAILGLQYQVKSLEAELDLVLAQLAYCQSHAAAVFNSDNHHQQHGEVIGLQSLLGINGQQPTGVADDDAQGQKLYSDVVAYKVFDSLPVKMETQESESSLSCSVPLGNGNAMLAEHHYVQLKPSIFRDFEHKERNHVRLELR